MLLHMKRVVQWSIMTHLLLTITSQISVAQEIEPTYEVVNSFKNDLEQARLSKDTMGVFEHYIGRLIDRGNYVQADSILTQNATGLLQIQDSSLLVNIYLSRAFMFKVQKRFEKSLEDYLWLTSYFEHKNDPQGLIEIYSLMAEYYRAIAQYDLSGKHLRMAESLFKEVTPSDKNLAYWYSRKSAWANEVLSNNDSVVYYAKKGLSLASEDSDVYTRALLLNELGFNAMHNDLNRETVLSYFNDAKDLLFKNERYRDYVEVVNNIGIYEYRFGSKFETIRLLEELIQIEEENKWYAPLETTYRYLTGAYRDTGQLAKAVEMSEWATATVTRNMTARFRIQMTDLALNYEKGLAEKELEVQEQKTKTAETIAKSNRRKFIISLTIAVILLVLVVIVIQVSNRFRRKNELLRQQQVEISDINQKLEKALSHQTTLYKELNHRVKNNLAILSGLIYLQQEQESHSYTQEVLKVLRNRIKSLAFSHDNLYQNNENEEVDFHHYLQELLTDLQIGLMGSKNIKTHVKCEELKLNLNQATPLAMVINELFTNSLKHGFKDLEEGTVSIKALHKDDAWLISYEDDGHGIDTLKEEGSSIGLTLVKLLIEQLDGTITRQESKKGISFSLCIPFKQPVIPEAQITE